MTDILDSLKNNLKLFELKQDSYSDVVPELEKMCQKNSSKVDNCLTPPKSTTPPKTKQNRPVSPANNKNNAKPNTNSTSNNNVNKSVNNGPAKQSQGSTRNLTDKRLSNVNNNNKNIGAHVINRSR